MTIQGSGEALDAWATALRDACGPPLTANRTMGALGGLVLTRVLQGQLYAVRSTDPGTFALVGAIIASVALLASLFPALRATRIDPAVALRDE